MKENRSAFIRGMRDGVPIGLGYFTVAFSLGIIAGMSGLDAVQGFFASLFTIASAGEYAGFTAIAANLTYIETAFIMLITNCRYFLMSAALSQKVSPNI